MRPPPRRSTPPPSCPAGAHARPPAASEAAPGRLHGTDAEPVPDMVERLRREYGTLAPVEVAPDVRAWLVLSYDLAREILQDHRRFPRDPHHWRFFASGALMPEDVAGPLRPFRNALASDGTAHARYRGAVVSALSTVTTAAVAPQARRHAQALLAPIARTGSGDLTAYAFELPLRLLATYFGFSRRESDRLVDSMGRVWQGEGSALADLGALALEAARARRRMPGEDVVSALVAASERLDDSEVADQVILLISAAHDPLANLIGNALHALVTDTGLHGEVRGRRAQVDEVVDAVLWRDPPIALLPGRYAAHPMTVEGQRLQRGDLLIPCYLAANGDPAVAPAVADDAPSLLRRSGARAHLSWGTGPHQCPARQLAHRIAVEAVEAALITLPGLALAPEQEPVWRTGAPFAHGLAALPVRCNRETAPRPTPREESLWPAPTAPSTSPTPPSAPQSGSPPPRRSRGSRWREWRSGR
ncbi:cytochrome P450 family protein [Nocardiopsis coralliicola]